MCFGCASDFVETVVVAFSSRYAVVLFLVAYGRRCKVGEGWQMIIYRTEAKYLGAGLALVVKGKHVS